MSANAAHAIEIVFMAVLLAPIVTQQQGAAVGAATNSAVLATGRRLRPNDGPLLQPCTSGA